MTTSAPRITARSRAAESAERHFPVAVTARAGYRRTIVVITRVRPSLLVAALISAALAAPASATAAQQTFTDPIGDNIGLAAATDPFPGATLTAPDIAAASQQLLPDGRVELQYVLQPGTIGVCRTLTPDGDVTAAVRPNFALFTDSTADNGPDFRIVFDTTENTYVIRDNTTTRPNIAQIEGIDGGGSITVRFDPKYAGRPQQLRWMVSQTCKGRLPWEDVERAPNTGTYALDLPFPPKPDRGYDPPTPGSPDPLPDALPPTTSAAQARLSAGASTAANLVAGGIPGGGTLLTFGGLPAGNVLVVLGTTSVLARGSADTKGGTAHLRLRLTKAGRSALHGTGALKTRLKFVFSPRGGGRQTTILRRITVKRRR